MDKYSFDDFYREHYARVRAWAKGYLANEEDADDTAQYVFLHKLRHFPTYDPKRASYETWLKHNTRNRCIDVIIMRTRRGEAVELESERFASRERDPAAYVPTREVVTQCLALLPDMERAVVWMRLVEKCTWDEISQVTGLTVSQVRTRHQRGAGQLADCLRGSCDLDGERQGTGSESEGAR